MLAKCNTGLGDRPDYQGYWSSMDLRLNRRFPADFDTIHLYDDSDRTSLPEEEEYEDQVNGKGLEECALENY